MPHAQSSGTYSRLVLCIMPHANFERAAARGGAADDTPLVLAPRANPRALALLLASPGASPDASRVHYKTPSGFT
jgi:hypothetical protein